MKNLLIYVNPRKGFDEEHSILAKIQIDNSFRLGWKKEDILMATNFPFEYNGFKSIEIPDSCFCDHWPRSSKITGIIHLLQSSIIDELCWFHDFDAFQLCPIVGSELGLDGLDMGFTDYGWKSRWNTGSFFFRPNALEIFIAMSDALYMFKSDEEDALALLIKHDANNINGRYKKLNITYNIGMNKLNRNVEVATKPLKVLHFHPGKRNLMSKFKPLMPVGLVEIMDCHGYK